MCSSFVRFNRGLVWLPLKVPPLFLDMTLFIRSSGHDDPWSTGRSCLDPLAPVHDMLLEAIAQQCSMDHVVHLDGSCGPLATEGSRSMRKTQNSPQIILNNSNNPSERLRLLTHQTFFDN